MVIKKEWKQAAKWKNAPGIKQCVCHDLIVKRKKRNRKGMRAIKCIEENMHRIRV